MKDSVTHSHPQRTIGTFTAIAVLCLTAWATPAHCTEAANTSSHNAYPTIATLAKHLPNLPKIEEVRPVPNLSLFELRSSKSDLYYTDTKMSFLFRGELIDAATGKNLTRERVSQLEAIRFDSLPLADSITIVRGKGERKLAVFEDPNCGFCKKFDLTIQNMDNVIVHVFLYPILGADSMVKSKNIWCAKDKAATYVAWMTKGVVPEQAVCDTSAIERNVGFGRANAIKGTPTSIFASGARGGGFMDQAQIEAMLKH